MKLVRNWFRVENQGDDPSVAHIFVYDDIGKSWYDDNTVTAKKFLESLNALSAAVTKIVVHVNCLGGDCFEATTIANALRAQTTEKGRTVEALIEGIAASAASYLVMAASKITIADNALVMIHNPWSIEIGNAGDFRRAADALDKIRDTIVATYKWHVSLEDAAIIALMDAETWMNADEAIANGFATDKVEGLKAAASISPRATDRLTVPEQYRDRVSALLAPAPVAPKSVDAATVIDLCETAGLDLAFAKSLNASALSLEQAQARIGEEKTARAAATARASEITAVCAAAKQPTLADGYIKGQMSPADVKAHLVTITAQLDRVEIDSGLHPARGTNGHRSIDRVALYNKFNKKT